MKDALATHREEAELRRYNQTKKGRQHIRVEQRLIEREGVNSQGDRIGKRGMRVRVKQPAPSKNMAVNWVAKREAGVPKWG